MAQSRPLIDAGNASKLAVDELVNCKGDTLDYSIVFDDPLADSEASASASAGDTLDDSIVFDDHLAESEAPAPASASASASAPAPASAAASAPAAALDADEKGSGKKKFCLQFHSAALAFRSPVIRAQLEQKQFEQSKQWDASAVQMTRTGIALFASMLYLGENVAPLKPNGVGPAPKPDFGDAKAADRLWAELAIKPAKGQQSHPFFCKDAHKLLNKTNLLDAITYCASIKSPELQAGIERFIADNPKAVYLGVLMAQTRPTEPTGQPTPAAAAAAGNPAGQPTPTTAPMDTTAEARKSQKRKSPAKGHD